MSNVYKESPLGATMMYKQTSVLIVLFLSISSPVLRGTPKRRSGLEVDIRWQTLLVRKKGLGLLPLVLGSLKGRGFCVLITVSCSCSAAHSLGPPLTLSLSGANN